MTVRVGDQTERDGKGLSRKQKKLQETMVGKKFHQFESRRTRGKHLTAGSGKNKVWQQADTPTQAEHTVPSLLAGAKKPRRKRRPEEKGVPEKGWPKNGLFPRESTAETTVAKGGFPL